MGFFSKLLGDKAKQAMAEFSGSKDFLEGMIAWCVLVAGAKGEEGKPRISDDEYDKTMNVLRANSNISANFDMDQVESMFGKLAPKVESRSGRNELRTEIKEAVGRDKSGKMAKAMALAGLDVADSGGIDKEEEDVMRDLCKLVGVSYDEISKG